MKVDNTIKWKGADISMSECVDVRGLVYQYDGEDFHGYCAIDFDEDGNPFKFAPFSLDNSIIDDYFEDEGVEIAAMCGISPDEMDYEWKFDALMAYYGYGEFLDNYCNKHLSREELVSLIKNNWFGNADA